MEESTTKILAQSVITVQRTTKILQVISMSKNRGG